MLSASSCAVQRFQRSSAAVAEAPVRASGSDRRSAAKASRQSSAASSVGREALRQQSIEFVEFRLRGIFVCKSGGTLHLTDDRIKMRCPCAAVSRSSATRVCVSWRDAPGAQPSVETCQSPVHRRATPLGLRRSLLSTSVAAADRVLLPVRQAPSARSRGKPRTGPPPNSPRSAAQARTGPAMPLRSCAPRSSSSKRLPTSLRVLSAITTLFGSAMPCKRAARLREPKGGSAHAR